MNLQKFAERLAGWTTLTVTAVIVDDFLWPAVILWQGPIIGGITMFWVALLGNLILIWAYDKIKRDVLAFEALRELTEQDQTNWGKRLLVKFIKAGKVPAFIAISFYDPFLSVIYMRKGAGKYTMEKRDWGYFALAMTIACVGWTFWWQIVITLSKVLWGIWA
jgi:hypothetical protein